MTDRMQQAVKDMQTSFQRFTEELDRAIPGWRELIPSFAPEKANLGLATTKQLLEELQARGQMMAVGRFEPYRPAFELLESAAARLVEGLPTNVLEYRPVDRD